MAGRWRAMGLELVHYRWAVAGLTAVVVILVCMFLIPQWILRWELGVQAQTLTVADKAKALNDIRTTLLQGIGGVALLLGAYFTYHQLQTGREQVNVARQQAQAAADQAREQLALADRGRLPIDSPGLLTSSVIQS